MNLIYEPTVIPAWKSEVVESEELFSYHAPFETSSLSSDTEQIPEIAGRICYQSFGNPRPGGNAAYLKRILSEGHGSVLEHSSIGFIIHGVSRSLTHELIRHRAGTAVSELSQRFVDADNLGFVVPPRWGVMVPNSFIHACKESLASYKMLVRGDDPVNVSVTTLERKRIREAARSVLPNCTETHIAFTANLRAWRNILEQRGNIHADLEIRRLAVALLKPLKKYAPNVFQDMESFVDEDGRESVKGEWKKV